MLANGFTTGSEAAGYDLTSVTIAIVGNPIGGTPVPFTVQIFDELGGLPNTSIGTLSGPTVPLPLGDYTYIASGITLDPNTTYFAVATADTYGVFITSSGNQTATGGWSIDQNFYIEPGNGWALISGDAVKFEVLATVVPEPSSLACLGLGGLLVINHRRRS